MNGQGSPLPPGCGGPAGASGRLQPVRVHRGNTAGDRLSQHRVFLTHGTHRRRGGFQSVDRITCLGPAARRAAGPAPTSRAIARAQAHRRWSPDGRRRAHPGRPCGADDPEPVGLAALLEDAGARREVTHRSHMPADGRGVRVRASRAGLSWSSSQFSGICESPHEEAPATHLAPCRSARRRGRSALSAAKSEVTLRCRQLRSSSASTSASLISGCLVAVSSVRVRP